MPSKVGLNTVFLSRITDICVWHRCMVRRRVYQRWHAYIFVRPSCGAEAVAFSTRSTTVEVGTHSPRLHVHPIAVATDLEPPFPQHRETRSGYSRYYGLAFLQRCSLSLLSFFLSISHLICLRVGGSLLSHQTIRYLRDRYEFEYKWLSALSQLDIPCLLLWGDKDAVAPFAIARFIHEHSRGKK